MTWDLPQQLTDNIATAEVEIQDWNQRNHQLVLRIRKSNGSPNGLLKLKGVTHLQLASDFELQRIELGTDQDLPGKFFERYRPGDNCLLHTEQVVLFFGSLDEKYFIIAQGAEYEMDC